MGTIFSHREPGLTNIEWFTREWYPEDEYIIHAHATVRGVFYAAVEYKPEPGIVWALIVITHWSPNSYCNFGETQLDETVGSSDTDAPARVLDALTPPDRQEANEWRKRCRKKLEHRQWVRDNIRPGTTFRVPFPVTLSDGITRDTFTYRLDGRRDVLVTADGTQVRWSAWRDMRLTVIH